MRTTMIGQPLLLFVLRYINIGRMVTLEHYFGQDTLSESGNIYI
jgi:hypothetical protein